MPEPAESRARLQVLRLPGDDFVLVLDGVSAELADHLQGLDPPALTGARGMLVFDFPVDLVPEIESSVLPPDLLARVTADARTSGVSVSDWLAAAVTKHLSRHPGRIRTEEM